MAEIILIISLGVIATVGGIFVQWKITEWAAKAIGIPHMVCFLIVMFTAGFANLILIPLALYRTAAK